MLRMEMIRPVVLACIVVGSAGRVATDTGRWGECAHVAIPGSPVPALQAADPPPADPKITEIANKHFTDMKKAIVDVHARLPESLTAGLQAQRLRDQPDSGKSTWGCAQALRDATDKSADAKRAFGEAVDRAARTWNAAKQTAAKLPATALPWIGESQAIGETIRRIGALRTQVNKCTTAKKTNETHLATLWADVQEYAGAIPSILPQVSAEKLVPATVGVPCINQTVYPRKSEKKKK